MTAQTAKRQTSRAPKARPRPTPRPAPSPDPLARFEVRDRERVEKALQARNLGALVKEMRAAVDQYFNDYEYVLMEAEGAGARPHLAATVVTRAEDARERLRAFEEGWAAPQWSRLSGRLHLTIACL